MMAAAKVSKFVGGVPPSKLNLCVRERERGGEKEGEREEGKLLEEVKRNTSCLFELLLCDDKLN